MNRVWIVLSVLVSVSATGQQKTGNHDVEFTLLNVGTPSSPIKVSKRWFEEDTIYIITFLDAKRETKGKTVSQGFFKSGLKQFGHALNATLTIDSTQEVRYGKWNIIRKKRVSRQWYNECTFSSSTGILLVSDGDVQALVHVIKEQ